jgi:porin
MAALGVWFSVVAIAPTRAQDSALANPLPTESLLAMELADASALRHLRGDRVVPPPPTPPTNAPASREWFGQSPWWQWSRVTGDWAGARPKLEERGLKLAGDYILDWSAAFSGGAQSRSATRGLLDVNLTLDTQPSLGIKGGTFYMQYYFRHGPNAANYVGDLQSFDNIDARRFHHVEELWYEQKLLDDHLRIKLGQVDANAEFDFLESAAEFLNATAGYSPTLSGLPTYPDTRLSANVFVYPVKNIYVGGGVYGSSLRGGTGFRHPYTMGEIGLTHPASPRLGAGRLALGFWHDDQPCDRYDGSAPHGATGFYLAAEQRIWRKCPEIEDNTQGLSLLFQFGQGDPEIFYAAQYFAAGLYAQGLVPGRPEDAAGLRASLLRTSRAAGSGFDRDEMNWEAFYRIQLTPCMAIKPDLQWIQHPGGTSARQDAVVGTLRFTFDF